MLVLAEALQSMVVIAFRVSSGTSTVAAQLLEKVGYKFVDDITDWLHKRYKSEIALGYTGPPVGTLKATLHEMVRNAVDDFHHGMVGEERLK